MTLYFLYCTRVQFPALEFGCWAQAFLEGLSLLEEAMLCYVQVPAFSCIFLYKTGTSAALLTSSLNEWVQLLEIINSSVPTVLLLKWRKWSWILCCNWQRLDMHGNSHWADAMFPAAISCSLSAFAKARRERGESILYRVLHFTAANYSSSAPGHLASPGFHSLLQQYEFLCHD